MRTEAGSVQEGGGDAGHSLHDEVGVVAHDGAGNLSTHQSDCNRIQLVERAFQVMGQTLENVHPLFPVLH